MSLVIGTTVFILLKTSITEIGLSSKAKTAKWQVHGYTFGSDVAIFTAHGGVSILSLLELNGPYQNIIIPLHIM
jgi:hypothetical protein